MTNYIAVARRTQGRDNLVLRRAINEYMWGIFQTPHKFVSMDEAQQEANTTEPPVHLSHISIEAEEAFSDVLKNWNTSFAA